MNERHPPDEVLNSALYTPVEFVHHNRRLHTVTRESWRFTRRDFHEVNYAQQKVSSHALVLCGRRHRVADSDAHIIYREQKGVPFENQGVSTLLRNSPM